MSALIPLAGLDRHTLHVTPPQLRPGDHVLAVDLPDDRHTHLDLPDGPTVFATKTDPEKHVTVVALIASEVDGGGDRTRVWPEAADVTVYRRPAGGAA